MDTFYAVFGVRTIKNQFDGSFFVSFLASGQLKIDLMDAFCVVFGLKIIKNQFDGCFSCGFKLMTIQNRFLPSVVI